MLDQMQTAVEITGLQESKISSVAFELDYLRKNGLLVDINVTGVGMFTRSASFGEIGIAADDDKVKRYTPGSKFLIPQAMVARLRSVEVRMRQLHVKFCTDVGGFRPYRWLPHTGYYQFRSRFDELKAEFYAIKHEIIENWDGYRDLLASELAAGAHHTWQAIEGQGYGAIIMNGRGYAYESSFTDAVVESALAQLPSQGKIELTLHADYKVGVIFSEFDFDAAREISQAEADKAKAEAKAASLQADMLLEAHRKQLWDNQIEQSKKEVELEAMMAAEIEHAKAQLSLMRSPFEDVFINLRCSIADACDEIAASIAKNGFVRGKVAERARGLLDFYDVMAAHNDKELRAKLVELRNQIGAIGDERTKETPTRSPEAVAAKLAEIIELANIEADDLANLSRAAFLEI